MLLFRILFFTAALGLLAGCGFAPLYATGEHNNYSISPLLADIEISNIPEREGQILRNHLIDRIYTRGRPEAARYELRIARPKENILKLGIRKDASATRAQMRISTTMLLTDRYSGETVISRNLQAVNSYNILDSQFTTMVSEDTARNLALENISDQIVTQIALYFKRGAEQKEPVQN